MPAPGPALRRPVVPARLRCSRAAGTRASNARPTQPVQPRGFPGVRIGKAPGGRGASSAHAPLPSGGGAPPPARGALRPRTSAPGSARPEPQRGGRGPGKGQVLLK